MSNPSSNPAKSGKSQVTGTLVETLDTSVIGMAPAVAMASLYTSMAQSNAILYENAVAQSRLGNASADLAVLGGLMKMYDGGKIDGSSSIDKAKNDLSELVKLLNTLG